MNDPLKIDQPGGLRNAFYGVVITLITQAVVVIWWVSQTEARFEARLDAVERQQTSSQVVIDKLNDSREDTRVHFAQIDGQLTEVNSKLGAILDILQQPDAAQSGGTQNGGPENFHHPQGQKR